MWLSGLRLSVWAFALKYFTCKLPYFIVMLTSLHRKMSSSPHYNTLNVLTLSVMSRGSALKWFMFLNRNSIQLHKLNLKYTLVCSQYHINLWVFLSGNGKNKYPTHRSRVRLSFIGLAILGYWSFPKDLVSTVLLPPFCSPAMED